MKCESFGYKDERFADIQMLRYRLNGFDSLTLSQKKLVYYLSQATLYGRDITFDQFGKHNLRIRKILEVVYRNQDVNRDSEVARNLILVSMKCTLERCFIRLTHDSCL